MKKQLLILMMSLFAITMMAEKKQEVTTFNVPMTCENCVTKIESNMAFEKGVKDLECNLENKTVKVTYLAEKTDVEKLKKGFEKIGYEATVSGEKCCESKQCKGECKSECKGECKNSESKTDCCAKGKSKAVQNDSCTKGEMCNEKKAECCKDKAEKETSSCCGK